MYRRIVLLFIVVLGMTALAGPAASTATRAATAAATASEPPVSPTVVIPKGQTIKIGWQGDLSLQLVKPSQGVLDGSRIAVNRINAAGGIQGFKFEVIPIDDQCTADNAEAIARQFAATDGLVAVAAPVCSGVLMKVGPVFEHYRIVVMSPTSTAAAITAQGWTAINRVAPNDSAQTLAAALYIYQQLGKRTLAILDDGQDYGKGIVEGVSQEFQKLGGKVLNADQPHTIDKDTLEYTDQLNAIAQLKPQVLFWGGYHQPAAALVSEMRQIPDLKDTIFFGPDGTQTADFLYLAGADAEGAYNSSDATSMDKAAEADFIKEFEAAFQVNYHDLDSMQPLGYDAVLPLAAALKQVSTLDKDGNLVIDREAFVKAVRATKDIQGLTGTLTCASNGDCGAGVINIYTVKNGSFQLLKSYTNEDLAEASQ